MNNHKTVFFSAEDFGFGPISILVQILKLIPKNIQLITKCTPQQEIFYNKNQIKYKNFSTWNSLLNNDVSLVISCQDPIAALMAWKHCLPCIYIDNFFWFWRLDSNRLSSLYTSIKIFKSLNDEAFLTFISSILSKNPHDIYLLIHLLTKVSTVQNFGEYVDKRIFEMNQIKRKVYYRYGAIITKHSKKQKLSENSNYVYVQMGGMKNILVSNMYINKYIDLVCGTLNEINHDNRYIIECKLHDDYEYLRTKYNNLRILTTISLKQHMSNIANCDYLFIQPGINGIYEAAYYDKSIFILPELNPSHSSNLGFLHNVGFFAQGHYFKASVNLNEDTVFENKYLERSLSNPLLTINKYILKKKVNAFLSKKESATCISERHKIIKRLVNNFDGIEQIIPLVNSLLNKK